MLKNKSAIVTGSTSGIGLGIAHALAGQGANIMLNGFGDSAVIADLVGYMRAKYGVQVLHSAADMAQPEQIAAMVGQAAAEFGAVDILVNNAGIQHTARVEDFPVESWDRIMAINLSSNFHAIRAALPQMQQRDWGRIINIASVHGLVASAHKSAYVAAKHGVIGLSKTVALENARSGVTCNAICPGWVLTPLVQKQIDDLALREGLTAAVAQSRLLGEKQPSMEFATPEQIGAIAVFLCSPAADQIRGAALNVDGGWAAQ
ncbi:3-hydroxybutyrate dehydrogenase [Oxalobacteraceae bacterium]|nr:3-hydroxybutyrate dehydrogenase [Oxalobacteraceae bacterium]